MPPVRAKSSPATHENFSRDEDVKRSSDRAFGRVFSGVFFLLALAPVVRLRAPRWWAVAIALAFLVVGLVYPRTRSPLNKLWFRLGLLLHAITTPLILGLVYYTTITPIGVLMRTLGQNPLRLRLDRSATTYWIDRRPPGPAPDTMPRQF
jgi:Saxitoxin biosynthesis operon protein SxtJ